MFFWKEKQNFYIIPPGITCLKSTNELSPNPRLFADDTFLFSVVRDTNLSANALNNDLLKINNWTYQWEISFNPGPSKQAQEVIFSRKIKKPSHPVLISSNNWIIQTPYQKHLGLILEEKLNFGEYLRYIANKVYTSIGLLRKLQKYLPRQSLVTLSEKKSRQKMTNFFASDEFFCRLFFNQLFFLQTINSYRLIFLPTFF